ncbi:MAG TPA: hypothetical protein VMW08_10135 [Acidimicrobiales bacterium]|nr:hypothetical protein [Acidimicrobiales bacterium]
MNYRLWTRIALGYLTLMALQIGVWALVAPRSFYDDYPGLGRAWISVDGPFNEHLIRDVGALNLALAIVMAAAAVKLSRDLVVVAALASLMWGVPHFLYHLVNQDGLDGADVAASLGGLAVAVLLPLALLWIAPKLQEPDGLRR